MTAQNQSVSIKARAKINLTLDILGRRADGFHELDMLMLRLSLCDTVRLEKRGVSAKTTLATSGGSVGVSADDNIMMKAHAAVEAYVSRPLPCAMFLEKRVPVAAGLGGGSADAAAVITGLNELFRLNISEKQLLQVGAQIGSDVPFFMISQGGDVYRATGRGTVIDKTGAVLTGDIIVIKPCYGLSTAEVFGKYAEHEKTHPHTDGMIAALKTGDYGAMRRCSGNALLPAAAALRPEIPGSIAALYENGASFAQMSGSGPCVFGVFADVIAFENALARLKEKYSLVYGCRAE